MVQWALAAQISLSFCCREAHSEFNSEISSEKFFCQSGFCESVACGVAVLSANVVIDNDQEWDLVEYAGVLRGESGARIALLVVSVKDAGRVSSWSKVLAGVSGIVSLSCIS